MPSIFRPSPAPFEVQRFATGRNRALYERLGFVMTATIRIADCPPIYPMVRPSK